MLKRKLKEFKLRKSVVRKDAERNVFLEYLEPVTDRAVIWPAGGKVQSELYGLRVPYIMNMNYYGNLEIAENDGICIDSDKPNYKVISIRQYTKFKLIEIEKIKWQLKTAKL